MVPLRPLVWVVNLGLLGAVSYNGAALSMYVLEQRLESATPMVVRADRQPEQQAAQEELPMSAFQRVLDANIFGARRTEVKSGTEPTETTASAPAPPPPATLDVLLTGTAIMGERAFAMVADLNGRNENVYRLWDCLPAGANHPTRTCDVNQGKLVSVRKKRIVVQFHGERLTFELADRPAPRVAAVQPAAISRRTAPAVQQAPSPTDASAAPFPISQEGNVMEVRVPGAEVSKAFENFAEVLKQARVVPYTDASGQGFQIRNIRPGSIFERIGLNNFDKIKAVNGEPITTADQALRLLTMFRNEKEITLDLERRNTDLQLNYVIE